MKLFPVALQLYSIREDMEKDFFGTLEKVKNMGYDGVEFAGLHGIEPNRIKKSLNDLELTPISAHIPFEELMGNTERILATYAEIGCNYVAIPYLDEEYRPGNPGFEQCVKDIRFLGETAKNHGMILLYHNHEFEFKTVGNKYILDILYDSVSAEYLQTELDTCWAKVGGTDPSKYLLKYTGRAPLVHLKDYTMSGEKAERVYKLIGIDNETEDAANEGFEYRPLGHGVMDFPGVLSASVKAGTEWLVIEQDEPGMKKTAMECARMSIKYLKSLMERSDLCD